MRFAVAAGMPRGLLATVLVAAAVAAAGPTAATAGAATVAHARGAGSSTAGFWTARRMARARPLELVRGADGKPLMRRGAPPPFTSAQIADPTVPPLPTSGKLFGKLRGFGLFECSATVVDSASGSVILTAGHCVYDPPTGTAATKLSFVPAYANGAAPFGRWAYREAGTTRQWIRRNNSNYDYAAIVLRAHGGTPIESVVGARALYVDGPRAINYHAFGYPGNFANAQRLWSCSSPYAGDDPRPIPVGPAPVGMGCDMKEGASGGGWLNDAGRLVSVTSFGYRGRPGFLYGPYLTRKAANLVGRAGSR